VENEDEEYGFEKIERLLEIVEEESQALSEILRKKLVVEREDN